jgi:hypothetical protein
MSDLDTLRISGSSKGDIFDRVTRFIREVGFPIAVAVAVMAYVWIVGIKTNEYMARGTAIMERTVNVLERMEKKLP